ncbi:hypothetical protein ACH51_12055 [Ralstonia solanacearum]|nr:hypothetical protein ACH51_12055 [Ralstonia solanacearum]
MAADAVEAERGEMEPAEIERHLADQDQQHARAETGQPGQCAQAVSGPEQDQADHGGQREHPGAGVFCAGLAIR